ncbi:uncharacterized protein LOC127635041 [Xyrauchen texanus]|uniref:uncharacterized protein LOC127635041 n=1 Tax=Xyrauchen texanus TaxID=154827 RepID=UPI0022420567|nr:uncharacterized protein LOC127635041 [Xyrauchen texanus]
MGGETEDEDDSVFTKTDRPVKKKMKRSTYFNNDWLKNDNYSTWLKPTPGDPLYATCSVCSVKILVKHEGKTALDDHAKTNNFFSKATESTELLKVVAFVFSIPVSNAYAERVFSHMEDVWSDKRNRLLVAMVKSELQVRLNFKLSCTEFKTFIEEQKPLIAAAKGNAKYRWKTSKAKASTSTSTVSKQPAVFYSPENVLDYEEHADECVVQVSIYLPPLKPMKSVLDLLKNLSNSLSVSAVIRSSLHHCNGGSMRVFECSSTRVNRYRSQKETCLFSTCCSVTSLGVFISVV